MLGHLIYNYAHLDDCRIQQEIDKYLYAPVFDGVYTVHAFNGEKTLGYQQYLEDDLLQIPNRGHFLGACDLINAGLEVFKKKQLQGLRYVLVTAADTWLLDVDFLKNILTRMEQEQRVLAASSWGRAVAPEKPHGLSTDFFVIDMEWNEKSQLFPLDYETFVQKFADFLALVWSQPTLEGCLQYAFHQCFAHQYVDNAVFQNRGASFLRLSQREPIHDEKGDRRDNWSEIGLYTSPHPLEKQKYLQDKNIMLGKCTEKLKNAKDLSYYNRIDK